jgi:hypothetical protein
MRQSAASADRIPGGGDIISDARATIVGHNGRLLARLSRQVVSSVGSVQFGKGHARDPGWRSRMGEHAIENARS